MEPEEKGQAGTNLAIVILVLVIVVVGVKLLMSSSPAGVPIEEEAAAEEGMAATTTDSTASEQAIDGMMQAAKGASADADGAMSGTVVAAMPSAAVGKGKVTFSVSSPKAVNVLAIAVRNPWRSAEESGGWIRVYEGYKAIPANGAAEVYNVSLAAITYDKVRVRTISAETGETADVEKDMAVEVKSDETIGVMIAL